MPNWCSNVVTFNHTDQSELVRLAEAFVAGNPMETFMPFPNGEWEYGWCVENWGTKWDVECHDAKENLSEGALDVWFDSAWGPPVGFYRHLAELGFDVEAFYYESGMGFCGKYCSESGEDDCYEITGNSVWVEEHIPDDINQCFAISESMASWEEEEEEESK